MIIQSLHTSGRLSVEQLSELAGVSSITIRRDLAELESRGALRRVRGGATRLVQRAEPVPYTIQIRDDVERKTSLAEAASLLVHDYSSIIIDNGTTCLAVAREVAGRPITVMPLSLHAAVSLGAHPGPEVVVPGGPIEADSLAMFSSQAIDAVRNFRADIVFLGACAVSASRGLTSETFEDAAIKQAAIASADKRVLVTVADKLAQSSSFRFGELQDLTHLVTTNDAPRAILKDVEGAGVEVIVV